MTCLRLSMSILLLTTSIGVSAATLTVGHGPGFDYPTITAGIAAAASGDTVTVAAGVYDTTGGESFPILVGWGVSLRASNLVAPPTIRGDGSNPAFFYFSNTGGTLQGFRIENCVSNQGSAIRCLFASPTILDCVFENNQVVMGGFLQPDGVGHVLHFLDSSARVERCLFVENGGVSQWGGVISVYGNQGPSFYDCVIRSNTGISVLIGGEARPRFVNCLIADNRSRADYTASDTIECRDHSSIELTNCTVVANPGVGIRSYSDATSEIKNSVFWNSGKELRGDLFEVSHSCVRSWSEGEGNLSSWPNFRDWNGSDYRLGDGSPCVDRGSNALLPPGVAEDLLGNERIRDATVDMGAYEAAAEFVPSATDLFPPRLYVRADASPGGDGSSWETAFGVIDDALRAAIPGSEVWVTGGRYRESVTVSAPISLRGGLEGSETRRASSTMSSTPTIIDASGLGDRVMTVVGADPVTLEGVVLTGGRAERGGGINSGISSLSLFDCQILDNTADYEGGGLDGGGGHLRFESCRIEGNLASGYRRQVGNSFSISGGEGGGMDYSGPLSFRMSGTTFRGNRSGRGGSAIDISAFHPAQFHVRDCTIEDNVVEFRSIESGAVRLDGKLITDFERVAIRNNRISESANTPWGYALGPGGGAKLIDCRIENNRGMSGLSVGDATLTRCRIANNDGFGIRTWNLVAQDSSVTNNRGSGIKTETADMRGCTIRGNGLTGVEISGGGYDVPRTHRLERCSIIGNGSSDVITYSNSVPGGIRIQWATVTMADCEVAGNFGEGFGAGGVQLDGATATLTGCLIADNRTEKRGGGLQLNGSQVRMENCRVLGNSALGDSYGEGGGIYLSGRILEMFNCIVSGNKGRSYGAGIRSGAAVLIGTNCVVEGNSRYPYQGPLTPNGIRAESGGAVILRNSIVWNGTDGLMASGVALEEILHCDLFVPRTGVGNISEDPLFLQPWDGETANLRLLCNSPCVDSGTAYGAPLGDIEGTRRPLGAGVDMGAYENCAFDLSGDRVEDGLDLLFFPSEWYEPVNETNFIFDFAPSPPAPSRIDALDLIEWLEGNLPNQKGQK